VETPIHIPVLLEEVLHHLNPRPGAVYVDATVNGGGHTGALLDASAPQGKVIGIDRDADLIAALTRRRFDDVAAGRLLLRHASFSHLAEILADAGIGPVDGVLFDLGLSSHHLDRSGRGFSFSENEPLDMRFDPADPSSVSASEVIAETPLPELVDIFHRYGEERYASRIARTVIARRRNQPIESTRALLSAVEQSLPAKVRWRASRNAARIFQALRIAANRELAEIERALPQAFDALRPGGRLVVISFHSLEDRMVKLFFREQKQLGTAKLLAKKPIQPSDEEVRINPRAGSAKLRALEKLRQPGETTMEEVRR
jgi:16S rRNA (cytosine1402-N4)-methyltransferase